MACSRFSGRCLERRAIAALCLACILGFFVPTPVRAADGEPAVKMSRSGICHERGTVHYQQTIYFKAFNSMEACRAAGGRRMGTEYGNHPPQFDYRGAQPPRYYWTRAFVGFIVALVAYLGIVLPLWRRWKARRAHRVFEERQRRQWEGHKLGPGKRPRS